MIDHQLWRENEWDLPTSVGQRKRENKRSGGTPSIAWPTPAQQRGDTGIEGAQSKSEKMGEIVSRFARFEDHFCFAFLHFARFFLHFRNNKILMKRSHSSYPLVSFINLFCRGEFRSESHTK